MRMHRTLLIFFAMVYFSQTKAQYNGFVLSPDPTAFSTRFTEASQKTNSIRCDFVQEKNLSMLSEKIVSKGKFWFKKENRVRMEYNHPFQYLMILSNNNIYIKDGERENKISTKSNKVFQQVNQVMIDCIRGSALSNPDFSVRIFESGQTYLIELSPVSKNLKDYFKNINIIIDKKTYSATKIEMFELSGDNTIISFINKELNTPIPDALFTIH
jgi:outer membrane lipoprotein-sorting protein